MNIETVAVIDIGKTTAKLVLLDAATGAEMAVHTKANKVLAGPPYPHADVDGLFDFILASLAAVRNDYPVSAISITTHGATVALMAGDQLALPVLDYEHSGPDSLHAEYEALRPGFSESLSPSLPGGLNIGAQLFWQSRAFTERFASVTAILTYAQFWAFRLTGELASEVTSLGCHSDLWAPADNRFSEMVSTLGWSDLFPPLRRADEIIGHVSQNVAAATGLDPNTPVTVGIHDSNASLIPHLRAVEAPFNVISSGTWTIHMHVGGSTRHLDPLRDSLANVDYLGRAVPTARFMGGREYAALADTGAPDPDRGDAQSVIDQGAMALPCFASGVGPFPNRIGSIEPAGKSPTRSETAAMASLYLALCSQASLDICGLGNLIIVEGPLARNQVYLSALQQLTAVPVCASADATGTSLGAAMLFNNVASARNDGDSIYKYVERQTFSGLASYAAKWRELANMQ